MARSFVIVDTQVLIHFLANAYPWHGRNLFERAGGANWIDFSPDIDDGPQQEDLADETHELVDRNAALPAQCVAGSIY